MIKRRATTATTARAPRTMPARFDQKRTSARMRFHLARGSSGGGGPSRISRADLRISPESTLERGPAFGKDGRESDTAQGLPEPLRSRNLTQNLFRARS